VDPGKAVTGLARAAARNGVVIVDEAEVFKIEFSNPLRLHVRRKLEGRTVAAVVAAENALLATNAGGLELAGDAFGAQHSAEPKLTFALATAPLPKKQIAAIGMASGRPFYSVDLPYLWGRMVKNGGMIFGSGLVPAYGESLRGKSGKGGKNLWGGLEKFDVRRGIAAERLRVLEERVRRLHPALKNVKITHRWGGPIMITKDFIPVFRRHLKNRNAIVLGGFSGHGVALSVYLGKWAAEAALGRRDLPNWNRA
jgi:glycine/D-amino acid oxidase-like deaminating enzyme